ncbi:FAD-binding protein [Flavobacteriaceae bacterium]|nr:FAD-binding protein [Flavobacteriaceae bacterium]
MKAVLDIKLACLKSQLEGSLHYDNIIKALYATDASVYRELPTAVAFPKSTKDIQSLIKFVSENELSIIPRAAGTSLAGQCVGDGIVVDTKHFNQILEINAQELWVRVQPGVVRDELNLFLKSYGLFFGPNTSTANRCMMGGMVGNNSSGSTSIEYGTTRDHVIGMTAILSDGSKAVFNAKSSTEFFKKLCDTSFESKLYQNIQSELSNPTVTREIDINFPKKAVTRRNTGYAIDALLNSKLFSESSQDFNFCKLLTGSEGTLAFTTEIKLNLVPLPKPHLVLIAAHFYSINESLQAAVLAMKDSPSACELMDKTILDCTKENIEQQSNRFFIKGEPEAILIIEVRANSMIQADIFADEIINKFKKAKLGYEYPKITGKKTERVWNLRKAGLGLLANIPGDKKAVACIEDTAVAIEDLPEYITAFTSLLSSYGQKAVYYAHAGAGEIHLRPILDLKKSEDVKLFREISRASAKLVKQYRGSLSGEHGDGRVRAEFIPIVVGNKNYELFHRIKKTWDPKNIFNPGKIVNAKHMDENLRYTPDVETPEVNTMFNFEETGGILRTVEKCNGSGDCRKLNFSGGTMCPSYRATLDEKDSTRGRANVLRDFLTQNTKANPFNHPEIKEVMELCISCKGCKSECPSNVDMATLKAEFQFQFYQNNPRSFRDKLIANNAQINNIISKVPSLHNFISRQKWFKKVIGIAKNRSLPQLQKQTLYDFYSNHTQSKSSRKVYLFCDEYTNYYDVGIGQKAILLLNNLGYEVLMVEHNESGRAHISKGFLKSARALANANVKQFNSLVSQDIPLVGIEPSAILSFKDEYPNLVDKSLKADALELNKHVFLIEEFLYHEITANNIKIESFNKLSKSLLLHGHCHQKALSSTYFTKKILAFPLNHSVTEINSGCCGMAGSFGYEVEHYDLSQKIANQVLFPELRKASPEIIIVANGTSCRHQIYDGIGKLAKHPIEVLFDALQ